MAYDIHLADRIRVYLSRFRDIDVEEKKMFRGLAFMINGKMCINVSGENLMCRFDPELTNELKEKPGYMSMIMKGKEYKGYCYIKPFGYSNEKDFEYWISLCLNFNSNITSKK